LGWSAGLHEAVGGGVDIELPPPQLEVTSASKLKQKKQAQTTRIGNFSPGLIDGTVGFHHLLWNYLN